MLLSYNLNKFSCTNKLISQPGGSVVKNLPTMWEMKIWSLGQEDHLEKEMATHSSILPWEIPWREEPCRLQSMGSQRARHDLATEQQEINSTIN